MKRSDSKFLKSGLGQNGNLVEIRFYGNKRVSICCGNSIEYDSGDYTYINRFIDMPDIESDCLKLIKEIDPNISKLFIYSDCQNHLCDNRKLEEWWTPIMSIEGGEPITLSGFVVSETTKDENLYDGYLKYIIVTNKKIKKENFSGKEICGFSIE